MNNVRSACPLVNSLAKRYVVKRSYHVEESGAVGPDALELDAMELDTGGVIPWSLMLGQSLEERVLGLDIPV